MRTRVVVTLFVVVGGLSLVTPSATAGEVGVDPTEGGDGIDTHVRDGDPGSATGGSTGGPGPGGGRGTRGPVLYQRIDVDLETEVDGSICAYLSFGTTESASQAAAARATAESLVAEHGLCFASPTLPEATTATPAATPAITSPPVEALWQERVTLSQPEPRITPGRAIVGLPTYLEIDGPDTGTWHFDELGFAIDITASSAYDIDWGDGAVDLDRPGPGGPYPTGQLTHTYVSSGRYDLTVSQRWTASWTAIGPDGAVTSGTISGELVTEGVLGAFPVQELQAVRRT